ncbi:hypothetical protein GCM10010349_79430 [Streptomyces flavofungini]|nr:hypothetical protein GCM10010349_79430 [Streptomyces flavofungini]
MHRLPLESLPETLGEGVVTARADPAHAPADPVPVADLGERGGRVLRAPVRVEEAPTRQWAELVRELAGHVLARVGVCLHTGKSGIVCLTRG